MQHLETFTDLVDDLLQLAANHPAQTIRNIARRSICSFALLKARPDHPDALDGPEVAKVIGNALRMFEASPSGARN